MDSSRNTNPNSCNGFWASLEHQVKYKNDIEESKEIEDELKECAETIANTDLRMMEIRNKIEKQ